MQLLSTLWVKHNWTLDRTHQPLKGQVIGQHVVGENVEFLIVTANGEIRQVSAVHCEWIPSE